MPERGEIIRQQIIEAANRLFYQRGYNQTSFRDIADAVSIPRGNFYYYFKTKDDILYAVIDHRIESIRATLAAWDATSTDPQHKLRLFLAMLRNSDSELAQYGCPMGSLNIELGKAQPVLKAKARQMFDLFRDWLTVQLTALEVPQPQAMALHLLGRAQGIAVMAQTYNDTALLHTEIDQLVNMLNAIPAKSALP
jgi:AcrR family transcriptional regulator